MKHQCEPYLNRQPCELQPPLRLTNNAEEWEPRSQPATERERREEFEGQKPNGAFG